MSLNLDMLFLEPTDSCLEVSTTNLSTRKLPKVKHGERLSITDENDHELEGDAVHSHLRSIIAFLNCQCDHWKAQVEEHARVIADLDRRVSTDAACSKLPHDVLRRINHLESETTRLRSENAQLKESCKTTERENILLGNRNESKDNKLKGAKQKIKNAKQVADREEIKAKEAFEAKQRHLASQRKMKKERDDALAAAQEQKKLNESLCAKLEIEQCGAPHVRDAAADANKTVVVVPVEFKARRVDIQSIMPELGRLQREMTADVEAWYNEWRGLEKESSEVPGRIVANPGYEEM